jgi:hypothetical protein
VGERRPARKDNLGAVKGGPWGNQGFTHAER